jgi:endonuclease-3
MNPASAKKILTLLQKKYPKAKIILNYSNNLELLISIVLSAQTTDIQVNKVTKNLFPKYSKENLKLKNKYLLYQGLKIKKDMLNELVNFSHGNINDLENDIKSIGLYKNKAKNIKALCLMLLDTYKGEFPRTIEKLTLLPGVGRKTANVFLGNAFKISEGIAVDTHVKRLSIKYGFSKNKTPDKIEKDLMLLFDKKDWFKLTYLLIEHGREIRKIKKDFILEKNLL